jgi:hypothetical protein
VISDWEQNVLSKDTGIVLKNDPPTSNRISGVMVRVLASSAVDRGFTGSCKSNYYIITTTTAPCRIEENSEWLIVSVIWREEPLQPPLSYMSSCIEENSEWLIVSVIRREERGSSLQITETISHSEFSIQLDIYDQGGWRGSSLQITETISQSEFSIQLDIYDQGGWRGSSRLCNLERGTSSASLVIYV